ncbi:hypothetical protein ATANTOWER_007020, partial [Ataeniobius toweri]|nr:hypothetical protein [Ataeniobius toweri]
MGKPLSRPDCLRQSPRCLGKGDEDEAYIEDCYVPQRSIYDTMRINEQIDQGSKLCQPSRSMLGSGGEVRGEGSTLSSNGTIGADLGGVFVSRSGENLGGVKKLDERVIFDALKLTGDAKIMSPPAGSSGLPIAPSSSGAGGVVAVVKRRHQVGDKKDNPNRRSWKAFMHPSFPEFAERLEFLAVDGAEKRSSGAGIPLSPLQPVPSQLPPSTSTSSTPSFPPYTPSPLSSAPQTPPVSTSPALTPAVSPQQHPLSRQKRVNPLLQKQQKQSHVVPSLLKEQSPAISQTHTSHMSGKTPEHSPLKPRQTASKREEHRRTASSSKAGIRLIPEEAFEAVKTSDSERDSPLLDQDHGDSAPLIPPKPVFCPPTKARTWPRSITTGKRTQVGLRCNLPTLPPLPPFLGEENTTDEESYYLLDPPSPFLKEEGLTYGGLPLSPCISHEGEEEGLLGWGTQGGELRERTASELKFEEDERRILQELEEEGGDDCRKTTEEEEAWGRERELAEEERAQREEREWEAVLKLENREIVDQCWDRETLESEGWDLTGSSGHWPVLTPPTGFQSHGAPSTSPCPSSRADSDDLFLELEMQCREEEGEEGVEMSVDPEPLCDPYSLPCLEEEEEDEKTSESDNEGTLPLDSVHSADPESVEFDSVKTTENSNANLSEHIEEILNWKDHEREHGFIDEEGDFEYHGDKTKIEEEDPTDSALGQQLESDSSEVQTSQPERTEVSTITQTDFGLEKSSHPETDLDSGASSEHDGENYDEPASSPSRSPLNPVEVAMETSQGERVIKENENLATEWDVYEQSEPRLDSNKGVLMDDSFEPQLLSECMQDAPTSGQEPAVPSHSSQPFIETSVETDEASFVSGNVASGLSEPEQVPVSETRTDVRVDIPKSDSVTLTLPDLTTSAPPSSSLQLKSDSCGAGLDAKNSEVFVTSDSFVYLAVSVPPQYSSDCPPSPVVDSIPPSPISKPPFYHGPEKAEDGSVLSPDSFVYLAAPERPQPGPSEGGSACEDTQELDLDSYSEGTQSGVDGVEFVLGSMTGDSDWESDSSALDFTPVISSDPAWDHLEPGLLPSLFSHNELGQIQACGPQDEGPQTEAIHSSDPLSGADWSTEGGKESAAFESLDTDSHLETVEREQVDGIQPKLQHINAVGQGLIQSAAKHTDTQALEHDLETTNLRWNSLNKRVAERIAQLQEALLHCGKFQDALEPLLSWLSDTEELVANQRPPFAEYRVVKAQIQEQKLLQRLLDDRRPTVEMIRAEGARIAATADSQDQEKIQVQLQSLSERWTDLLDKASGRQRQLEEMQVLALQFHEALEPLGEWLSATEKRLSSAEPMGTQTAKITQQIIKHKALLEDVSSREAEVDHLESLSQSLSPLSCAADQDWLRERVRTVRSGHTELADWGARRAALLDQALANAQLFGEEEVEVLNWLAEVAQRLGQVSVQSYQPQLLAEQHKHTLALNEEILSRKKTVDQAIKNGQALLKQTTGEEVLLIQEKLDGIKSRYAEMTASSSKALRTLEQALQLSTRFTTAHDDLSQWLDGVEAELNTVESDASPAYQERQKELKKVSAEKRLVLDTVNEVGSALLDLVPWRAREGLDRLVADANQRYRHADETITQRVQLVQAAIQRSQQYEEAVDAELAWVGETERKLASLGPLSLEPDVTVAQLQVQRAFNIDIIRHKDIVDQLLRARDEVLEACSDAQKDALMVKTDSLSTRYDTVSQSHSERFSALEQAQVLVARFWETFEELEPWLGETEALITQLPPPAIDTDALRLQQDQMRLLRESIAEHKPHIDKLLKIGPQLAELSLQEGATVTQRYIEAERRYLAIKEEVKSRAGALDEAVSQSTQFHDKMDPLLETLEGAVQRLRQPPPVAAEVEKIREQLADHRSQGLELDKLLPSFSALCSRGEELIGRAAHDDPAAQAVRSRLLRLRSLWDEIRQRAEERESKLNDVLDLAGKFWADVAALLSTLRDSQDIVRELEDPGVDPSLIKQQIEAAEAIKAETDGLREELEFVRTLGADLIFACGETEKPEVKKTIDE